MNMHAHTVHTELCNMAQLPNQILLGHHAEPAEHILNQAIFYFTTTFIAVSHSMK